MSISFTQESQSTSLNPVELLQRLIRFDTTNPPGNERECVAYISNLFAEAGCDCTIVGSSGDRPNLITRLKGQSNAPPLLLYGHVDVVTTAGQTWQHPPFEGRLVDGYVWGRGALDMKSGIVMMLSAFLRAKAEDLHLAGDVILALVSDEEGGGDAGAKYLVENQSGLFQGGDTPSASSGDSATRSGGRGSIPSWWPKNRSAIFKRRSEVRAGTVHCPNGKGQWAVWPLSYVGWSGAACPCTLRRLLGA